MKIIFFVFVSMALVGNASAIELVCKGREPRMQNQKPIYVDCSSRKDVIDILGAAWRELRKQGIGGSTENMCWKPYQKAQEIHPSIRLDNIAPTFFVQCNMALQYVK